jgi:hypothetical protein
MRKPTTARRSRRVALVAGLGCLVVLTAGCSSGKAKVTPPAVRQTSLPPSSTAALPTSSAPATTPAAATDSGLSGSWSGQYNGEFTGTFKLTWQQTGSNLSGTIMLSTENDDPVPLTGTVSGSTISFGTVGSQAVTYSGTVSGNSMSGSYQVGGAPGGPWSASKS